MYHCGIHSHGSIPEWMNEVSTSRIGQTSVDNGYVSVKATRGKHEAGVVISPLLWSLEVYESLQKQTKLGF